MLQLRRPTNGYPAPLPPTLPTLSVVRAGPHTHDQATNDPGERTDLPTPVIAWDAIYAALDRWEPADQPTGEQIATIIATHDATRPKQIIVAGTPLDGYRFIGPVHTRAAETAEYIHHRIDTEWWFAPLVSLPDAAGEQA